MVVWPYRAMDLTRCISCVLGMIPGAEINCYTLKRNKKVAV